MTRIEKSIIVAIIVVIVGVGMISYRISESGGVRGMIVEAGKEVKSIIKEINDE